MKILALNPGSSSLKYGVFDCSDKNTKLLAEGKVEISGRTKSEKERLTIIDLAFEKICEVTKVMEIAAIGCRVVHGGSKYSEPVVIDSKSLDYIKSLSTLAPLHNLFDVEVILGCQRHYNGLPIVAVFDTAFHHSLAPVAAKYALPYDLSDKYELKRFGFHGIAHQQVSRDLLQSLALTNSGNRVITCHLGNGASICAIKDGKSIDTSMGLTPLEGLVMGTRCGDIDPGLLLYLINECGISPTTLREQLNYKSGLLGLSGLSADVRELEKAADTNPRAQLALDIFVDRVAKYIGAYYVTLSGIDGLAFSGGIGENSPTIRASICQKLSCIDVAIDNSANKGQGNAFRITTPESRIPVWVIHADENLEIASQVHKLRQ